MQTNDLKEQVKQWFDAGESNVYNTARVTTKAIESNGWLSPSMNEKICRLAGQYASDLIVANQTPETVTEVGKKLGVFLSSMEGHGIYLSMYELRKNLLQSAPELIETKSDVTAVKKDVLNNLAKSIAESMSHSNRSSVIKGLTDFYDETKKEQQVQTNAQIDEKIKASGISPHQVADTLAQLEKSYRNVKQMADKLGIEAPSLSFDRPKVNVAEFREKILNSGNNNNENTTKPN